MHFFKKNYPDFWINYLNHFKNKKRTSFLETRFVVFDTETTGLDLKKNCLLSIGAVGIHNQSIFINDGFECYISQQIFDNSTVKIHGIRKNDAKKISEKEAIQQFLGFIENAVLVGHHVNFDIEMIQKALNNLGLPKLKNSILDTGNIYKKTLIDKSLAHFSLDKLLKIYGIPPHDRHNAMGDAFLTAQVFLKIVKQLSKNNTISVSYLEKPANRIGLF